MPRQETILLPEGIPHATAGQADPETSVCTVAHSPADTAPYLKDWGELSALCAAPNPFCEPWYVLPAMAAFGGSDAEIVFVHDPAAKGGGLIGVVPIVQKTHLRGVPLRHVKLWTHRHCFMAGPLIRAGRTRDVWQALRHWARRRGAQILDLPLMPRNLDTVRGLNDVGAVPVNTFKRAVFRPHPEGADLYLSEAASAKSRKRWRRLRRQLEAMGDLTCETLGPDSPTQDWATAFMRLEASGWKGRDGTAMASDPEEAEFFRDMVQGAQRAGALHMMRLSLDGRAVAMQCNLFCNAQGYAFKVAYDEEFAAQSPGLQLELEAIRAFSEWPGLVSVDSCTTADSALMRRLWKDTVRVDRLFVPTGRLPGRLLCSALRLRGRS